MIKYNEYELLELFESEPKVFDDEVKIYEYRRQDTHGFTLKVYLSVYEGTCIIGLLHKDLEYPIFELDFHNIDTIVYKQDQEKLLIHEENDKNDIVIYFKPNYSLTTEEHLPM